MHNCNRQARQARQAIEEILLFVGKEGGEQGLYRACTGREGLFISEGSKENE
jgi:hypothetical protein